MRLEVEAKALLGCVRRAVHGRQTDLMKCVALQLGHGNQEDLRVSGVGDHCVSHEEIIVNPTVPGNDLVLCDRATLLSVLKLLKGTVKLEHAALHDKLTLQDEQSTYRVPTLRHSFSWTDALPKTPDPDWVEAQGDTLSWAAQGCLATGATSFAIRNNLGGWRFFAYDNPNLAVRAGDSRGFGSVPADFELHPAAAKRLTSVDGPVGMYVDDRWCGIREGRHEAWFLHRQSLTLPSDDGVEMVAEASQQGVAVSLLAEDLRSLLAGSLAISSDRHVRTTVAIREGEICVQHASEGHTYTGTKHADSECNATFEVNAKFLLAGLAEDGVVTLTIGEKMTLRLQYEDHDEFVTMQMTPQGGA